MSRHPSKKVPLNDFWIPGDGIEREVLQASIQNWLGADSTCAPMVKDGKNGFRIRALRQPTTEMLVDLKKDSRRYRDEAKAYARHGEEVPAFEETGIYRDIQRSTHSGRQQSAYLIERDYQQIDPPPNYYQPPVGRGGGSRPPNQQGYSDPYAIGGGDPYSVPLMNPSFPNSSYLPGQPSRETAPWQPGGGTFPSGQPQMSHYPEYSSYSSSGYDPSATAAQSFQPEYGLASAQSYSPNVPSRHESGPPRSYESRTTRAYDSSLSREHNADVPGGASRGLGASSQSYDPKKQPREYEADPSGGYSRGTGGSSQGYDPKKQPPSNRR